MPKRRSPRRTTYMGLAAVVFLSIVAAKPPSNTTNPTSDVFVHVAGVEGAGHHGVVYALLKGVAREAIEQQVRPRVVSVDACIDIHENPWKHRAGRGCPTTVTIAWQSLPSQVSMRPNHRLDMLYTDPECLRDQSFKENGHKWPVSWKEAGHGPKHTACLRNLPASAASGAHDQSGVALDVDDHALDRMLSGVTKKLRVCCQPKVKLWVGADTGVTFARRLG